MPRSSLLKGGQTTHHKPFIAAVAILSLVFAGIVFAERSMKWRGSGGWGPQGQYGRMYDPNTVETLAGEVVQVDRITPMKGMGQAIHMTVKTDQGTVSIHLGPAWYIENQDIRLEPKDTVEVRGSKLTFRGQPAIIAAEVKKGDSILKLRDETACPCGAAGADAAAPNAPLGRPCCSLLVPVWPEPYSDGLPSCNRCTPVSDPVTTHNA